MNRLPRNYETQAGYYHDEHDLTVDYEPHATLPGLVLKTLRSRGFHPDITSA